VSAWKHADSPRRSRGAACPQMWSALFALMLVACGTAAAAADAQAVAADEDPFASHVRPTDPLSPADEQAGFILPPGFIAELVASEETIAKPMNLAFDDSGRLWVSCSLEYPYAAPLDQPSRDFIKVFEDRDGDGSLETATTFADGLNIPIGLVPVADGVICYSIPNIWHLRDTDGDGRADKRTVLYGPMGWQRDTHGMCNAFRQGPDGWIYACHGFNNETTVSGSDGHEITMQSGNTFRFREDGSRIEHYTWGQVNPFGMDFDIHGDLFTADCHTKPVSLLLPEGRYESFGKPHDGLGFVPAVMDHLHGSTAIGGIAIYDDVRFPEAYRGSSFGGNVMTSRVNRNRLEHTGSTVRAVAADDFMAAADPWFRPVDLRMGPDGALYVADFYNRIIGHYEVPLDHPGRDRTRGRIWRIRYSGNDAAPTPALAATRLDTLTTADLVTALADANRLRRSLAIERLAAATTPDIPERLAALSIQGFRGDEARIAASWCRARRGELSAADLASLAAASSPLLREHTMRIAGAGLLPSTEPLVDVLITGLADDAAEVRRAAAMAVVQLPLNESLEPAAVRLAKTLVNAVGSAEPDDVHLRHALQLALRSCLRQDAVLAAIATADLDATVSRNLADVCRGLASMQAADVIVQHLLQHGEADEPRLRAFVEHAATQASAEGLASLAGIVQEQFAGNLAFQLDLLEAARRALDRQGKLPADSLRSWADATARRLLQLDRSGRPADRTVPLSWTASPLPTRKGDSEPWPLQTRSSADGTDATFRSSLLRGEQWRGQTRSEPFAVGDSLSFFLAGHAGYPDKPAHTKNAVRLLDAESDELLREAFPSRNDTAQPVVWNTSDLVGRRVIVEVVDGDRGDAYAWLAVGRFSVDALNPSAADTERQAAASLIAGYRLADLIAPLGLLITELPATTTTRIAAADAVNSFQPDARLDAVTVALSMPAATDEQREVVGRLLVERQAAAAGDLVGDLFRVASSEQQRTMAARLAADPQGCELLASVVERGICSPQLLADPAVSTRLDGLRDAVLRDRLHALAATAPQIDAVLARLIDDRRQDYREHPGDATIGLAVFRKNCAACHQVAGEGAKVGPQLDGIGNRGLDRVAEDLLDPNRNVDVAFRTTTFLTDDGRVLSGLVASENDDAVVCVDQQGKEFVVATESIDERRQSSLSVMPANFHETLSPDDIRSLLAYLLSLRE
jgi:putative heme-binding domain-containing protein